MDFKSKKKRISNSSSSSSDDPDYNESPQTRSVNKTKNLPIQIVVEEVGTSSGTSRRRRRRRVRPPTKRLRDEGIIPWSPQRPTRRRRHTNHNEDNGKRTILSWLIDTDVTQQNQKVCYMSETRESVWLEGIITRDGILCNCCDKIFNALDFEIHAGSDLKRPYENIFVQESRISLLSCMREAWERVGKIGGHKLKNVESKYSDKHDDACIICADGGNLLCCETCPSTYHQDCMAMEVVPEGAWFCPYCVCKFCGNTCGENDFLITCFQCEKRYHWECCRERRNSELIDVNSPFTPLCDRSCKEVFEKLEKSVGVRKELDEGFTWTLLRRMDQEFGVRVNDLHQMIECHSKLAIARIVIEECFETIIDRHTRINVLQNVVYNCESHYIRTNFRGFYTAILEKDEEVISVASLRIHGTKLAEMPFVATLKNYRSQGMCRRLMVAIESALCYLKVESLVIPSVHETIGSWIDRFGFKNIDPSMINELRLWNTLTFHDSVRLQKVLTFTAGGAREVHESENSENKNRPNSSNNFRVQALFDLNLEPPEEVQEISDDGDLTSNNPEFWQVYFSTNSFCNTENWMVGSSRDLREVSGQWDIGVVSATFKLV